MTNAEARCNKSLRPRKPEGSLGRTAQDGHLDSHTAPELYVPAEAGRLFSVSCCLDTNASDSGESLLCFLVGVNKSYVIATSDL